MGTAVMTTKTMREQLTRFQPRLAEVVAVRGADEYAQRQIGLAMLATQKNPDLLKCEPASIAAAMVRICAWRLEIGTTAHLVPFGRDCTPIIAWQGLVELMIRTGHVRDVYAAAVHQRDHFRIVLGTDQKLEHEPAGGEERGPVIGYYAVARLKFGYTTFEYMTEDEVEAIRKGARSCNSPAWKNHRGEMGKKTVLRRLAKRMPQNDTLRAAIEQDEMEAGVLLPAVGVGLGSAPLTDGRGNDGYKAFAGTPADDPYGMLPSGEVESMDAAQTEG